eukprot:6343018-Prymnesium_polylepis.3
MSEDCQRLNVYAPTAALQGGVPAPGMVWFHGGAYKEGSSFGPFNLYDAGNFSRAGQVVVVSCNYRLDVFGGLVYDGGLTGNYGLLDQRACLQWVQDEVARFGGDPRNVTAWGQSAGAQSVLLHMVAKGSAGLFHRAVLESTPALALLYAKDAAKLGRATAEKLGCHNYTAAKAVACMDASSSGDLLRAASQAGGDGLAIVEAMELSNPTASFLPFKPNDDGEEFVEQPMKTLLSGRAAGAVSTMIGFNHDEMWALMSSLPAWVGDLEAEAGLALLFVPLTAVRLWKHYSALFTGDTSSAMIKILTDYVFTCSSQAAALALPSPSYVYAFNHIDSFGPAIFGKFGLARCAHRACHMAEIPLVFGNKGPANLNATFSAEEQALSHLSMTSFSAFARDGRAEWAAFNATHRIGLVMNESTVQKSLGDVCVDIFAVMAGSEQKTGYLH